LFLKTGFKTGGAGDGWGIDIKESQRPLGAFARIFDSDAFGHADFLLEVYLNYWAPFQGQTGQRRKGLQNSFGRDMQ
jgi:hypothetical protein